jgi:tetratricopeptide (TPR) repeat protein
MMRALVIAMLLVGTTRVEADNKDQAKIHVKAADTDFKLGRFQEALDSYSKAYELYAAPAFLFNIAQCHRNLKNWERAIFFFEGYLRESPNAPNRQLVESLLHEAHDEYDKAQKLKAETDARDRQAADQQRATDMEEARRKLAAEERAVLERRAAQQQNGGFRDDRPRGAPITKKWWFWTAVGVVVIAAAGTTYYFAHTKTVPPMGTLGTWDGRGM